MRLIYLRFRFTDFLVYEVNLNGEVIHIRSLGMPSSETKKQVEAIEDSLPHPVSQHIHQGGEASSASEQPVTRPGEENDTKAAIAEEPATESKAECTSTEGSKPEPWPESFDSALAPYLSEPLLAQLKQMYLEGPEPPFVSDGGWAGRQQKAADSGTAEPSPQKVEETIEDDTKASSRNQRGKRGRDRGGRGRGGGGRKGDRAAADTRKVVSNVRLLYTIAFLRLFVTRLSP